VAPLLAAMRADLALGQSCAAAGQRLAAPITAFGGTDDAIDRPSLQAWRSFTTGSFRLRLFAGGHFYLTRSVEVVAAEIAEDLSQALGGERISEAG